MQVNVNGTVSYAALWYTDVKHFYTWSKLAAFKKACHSFEGNINQEQSTFQLDHSCSRVVEITALMCLCVCVCDLKMCVAFLGPMVTRGWAVNLAVCPGLLGAHKLEGNYGKQLDARFLQSCKICGCSLKGFVPSYLPKRNCLASAPPTSAPVSRQTSIGLSCLWQIRGTTEENTVPKNTVSDLGQWPLGWHTHDLFMWCQTHTQSAWPALTHIHHVLLSLETNKDFL